MSDREAENTPPPEPAQEPEPSTPSPSNDPPFEPFETERIERGRDPGEQK